MAVTDIYALRPETKDKSLAEAERLLAEAQMLVDRKRQEAEIAAKQELAAEANRHIDAVVAGVKWLQERGILPEKVAAGFKRDGDGMFSPAMFLRNVTAESLVGGKPTRQRRGRMTPAEREAAIAAGTLKPRRRRK
jgi:hypothetical protein